METAKVDIRKLQLLNDRISQTIDALNQVRLSVHGLSHSTAGNPMGLGQQQAGFAQPFVPGIGGIAQGGFQQPFVPGLSHTSMPYGGAPIGVNPFGIGLPQQGFAQQGFAQPFAPGLGYAFPQAGWNPLIQGFGGLSHSGVESAESYSRPTWSDPLLAAKVAQTFPYVQFAVPPVVTLY
jgi:hypothetical protein